MKDDVAPTWIVSAAAAYLLFMLGGVPLLVVYGVAYFLVSEFIGWRRRRRR